MPRTAGKSRTQGLNDDPAGGDGLDGSGGFEGLDGFEGSDGLGGFTQSEAFSDGVSEGFSDGALDGAALEQDFTASSPMAKVNVCGLDASSLLSLVVAV